MAKILAVDNHPINLAILEEMLDRHIVATARDGQEALAIAARFEPDVVLLDVMMPVLDGLETCRRLRSMPQLGHARIVMVSAKALASERSAGFAAGADEYLAKPFDEAELLEIVATAGGTSPAMDAGSG